MNAKRLLVPLAITTWCLSASSVTHTQATVQSFPFGPVILKVPPPAGETEVLSSNPQLRQFISALIQVSGTRLLAAYLPTDAAALPQAIGDNFAVLGTSPELQEVNVTAEFFNQMTSRIRTGFGDLIHRNDADISTALLDLSKRLNADIRLGSQVPQGVFDARQNRFGIFMAYTVLVNGSPNAVLSASSLVRVRNRLLFTYIFSKHFEPDAIRRLASAARAWTDSIRAANVDVQRNRQEDR